MKYLIIPTLFLLASCEATMALFNEEPAYVQECAEAASEAANIAYDKCAMEKLNGL